MTLSLTSTSSLIYLVSVLIAVVSVPRDAVSVVLYIAHNHLADVDHNPRSNREESVPVAVAVAAAFSISLCPFSA